MSERKLLELTELSRSSYYEAKRELVEMGILDVKKTRIGTCCYRLRGVFQPLIDDAESIAESAAEAEVAPPRPENRTPTNKEKKENFNKHHQHGIPVGDATVPDDEFLNSFLNERAQSSECEPQALELDLFPENELALAQSWKKVPRAPRSRPTKDAAGTLTLEQAGLADQIRRVGVSRHVASRLVTQKPAELILQALTGLQARSEIRNPAGWFVQEVMAGGYLAPQALQADKRREKAAANRVTERETEQLQREAANARALAEWTEVQRLAPDRLAQLFQTARAQLSRFSPQMAAAADDSPMMRAAVVDLYRNSSEATAYLSKGESP